MSFVSFYGYYVIDFFPDDYKPEPRSTGVAMETLKQIGKVVSSPPPGEFTVHSGTFDCWGTLIINKVLFCVMYVDIIKLPW